MTVKVIVLKGLKIAGWMVAGALASVVALVALFFLLTRPFYNEITSDLAKDQVINLNNKLSADEVRIYEVGMFGIQETQRRYPEYIKDCGSDLLHEPSEYWSVVAIHHKEKTFDQYLVNRGVVILAEGGPCSSSLTLRTEQSRGGPNLWFALAESEPPEDARR